MDVVETKGAPAAIGPYSQGVVAGGLLFASGQIALDPATGELVGETAAEQAEQVMRNVGALLAAAGAQYRLGGIVGLYFEPEGSYYLTETNLRTVRTDSPLTLTLRLGVRLTF